MDNERTIEADVEVLPPSSIEALERAQVDVQVATAHKFPRSIEQFKKRALSMATLDQETAESCVYVRPVGKDPETGKQKFAEGASVRLAEIVAASYGNLRFASRIVEQTERYVKAEGVAHDLESNVAAKSEVMESTVKKNGKPYDERMRIVVAKAALSKALRDAIFRVVPKAMCKSVYDQCKKVSAGEGKSIEQRRAGVKHWLSNLKVDEARMFAALGVKGWTEIGEDQLATLTGLKTAIADQDVEIEEAFPMVTKAPSSFGEPPPTAPTPTPALQPTPTPTTNTPAKQAEFAPGGVATEDVQGAETTPQLDALYELMMQYGVTEAQAIKFCHDTPGFLTKEQTSLKDLSPTKCEKLAKAWPNIVSRIKAPPQ